MPTEDSTGSALPARVHKTSSQRSAPDLNAGERHQEKTDDQLIEMWLDGKSEHTHEYYERTAQDLLKHIGKPIRQTDEADLQRWTRTLTGYAESTQATKINAARSLFSFAEDIGYIQYKVGKMLKPPKTKDQLHERLLTPAQVQRMIGMTDSVRNLAVLRTLYLTGARVTELTRLTWGDLCERNGHFELTIFGKGSKTRTIAIPDALAEDLEEIRSGAEDEQPLFRSREGGALSRHQVYYIVRKAAERAGIEKDVSPHWLWHAHASHALDNGAAPHDVKDTLGHASLNTTTRYAHSSPESSSAFYLTV